MSAGDAYVRRRAFNKVHVRSWLIYLEKDGCVRCAFANCRFMAFDIEEMADHYGFCQGEGVSEEGAGAYVCSVCNGRTDSQAKLDTHMTRSHGISPPTTTPPPPPPPPPPLPPPPPSDVISRGRGGPGDNAKPSRVTRCSWALFFERHGHVRCSACQYVANSVADMCRHYPICDKERCWLTYACEACGGRFTGTNPLVWHLQKAHGTFKAHSQFNQITSQMVNCWESELSKTGFAHCLYTRGRGGGSRGCCYFDTRLDAIIVHSQTCKGPAHFAERGDQCPACPMWTSGQAKLRQHVTRCHPGLPEPPTAATSAEPPPAPKEEPPPATTATPTYKNNELVGLGYKVVLVRPGPGGKTQVRLKKGSESREILMEERRTEFTMTIDDVIKTEPKDVAEETARRTQVAGLLTPSNEESNVSKTGNILENMEATQFLTPLIDESNVSLTGNIPEKMEAAEFLATSNEELNVSQTENVSENVETVEYDSGDCCEVDDKSLGADPGIESFRRVREATCKFTNISDFGDNKSESEQSESESESCSGSNQTSVNKEREGYSERFALFIDEPSSDYENDAREGIFGSEIVQRDLATMNIRDNCETEDEINVAESHLYTSGRNPSEEEYHKITGSKYYAKAPAVINNNVRSTKLKEDETMEYNILRPPRSPVFAGSQQNENGYKSNSTTSGEFTVHSGKLFPNCTYYKTHEKNVIKEGGVINECETAKKSHIDSTSKLKQNTPTYTSNVKLTRLNSGNCLARIPKSVYSMPNFEACSIPFVYTGKLRSLSESNEACKNTDKDNLDNSRGEISTSAEETNFDSDSDVTDKPRLRSRQRNRSYHVVKFHLGPVSDVKNIEESNVESRDAQVLTDVGRNGIPGSSVTGLSGLNGGPPHATDRVFKGFSEISKETKSHNQTFYQFLRRLSESENEEWYINAGNLTMDMRKDGNLFINNSNCKSKHAAFPKLTTLEDLKSPPKEDSEAKMLASEVTQHSCSTSELLVESHNASVDIVADSAKSISSTKRKRGRPPKKVNNLSVDEQKITPDDCQTVTGVNMARGPAFGSNGGIGGVSSKVKPCEVEEREVCTEKGRIKYLKDKSLNNVSHIKCSTPNRKCKVPNRSGPSFEVQTRQLGKIGHSLHSVTEGSKPNVKDTLSVQFEDAPGNILPTGGEMHGDSAEQSTTGEIIKPKNLFVDMSYCEAPDTKQTRLPKKRGRPPKKKPSDSSHIPVGNNLLPNENDLEPQITCSDTTKHSTNDDTNQTVETAITQSSRKRGRPRKPESSEKVSGYLKCEGGTFNIIEEPALQTGLPCEKAKGESSSSAVTVCQTIESENVSIFPKKRGRKPKMKENEPGSQQSFSGCVDSIQSPIGSQNSVTSSVGTLPKKRGRKPKADHQQTTSLDIKFEDKIISPESSIPPKKRGRKSKAKSDHGNRLSAASQLEAIEDGSSQSLNGDDESMKYQAQTKVPKKRGRKLSSTLRERDATELRDIGLLNINVEDGGHQRSEAKRLTKRRRKAVLQGKVDEKPSADNIKNKTGTTITGSEYSGNDGCSSDDNAVDYGAGDMSDGKPAKGVVKESCRAKKQKQSLNNPSRTNQLEAVVFRSKHVNTDRVVCGVCKQEMTYQYYKKSHAIFKHYMLCWLDKEEEPIDMSNEKEVVNRLWYSKKRMGKVPFRCPVCNLPKLSAVGFQSHIQFCGKDQQEKESLLAQCELCGARMMPSSMRPHMYIKHRTPPPQTAAPARPPDKEGPAPPRGRRAAAHRAVEVMQRSTVGDDDDDEEAEGRGGCRDRSISPDTKQRLSKLYMKPNMSVPADLMDACRRSLREHATAACPNDGCDAPPSDTTLAFRRHYLRCPHSPQPRVYRCRVCGFATPGHQEMADHLLSEHEAPTSPSPSPAQSSADDNSDSEGVDDTGRPRPAAASHSYGGYPFAFLREEALRRGVGRSFNKKLVYPGAMPWTHQLRQEAYSTDELFGEALASWQPLSTAEAEPHLPRARHSLRFGTAGSARWHTLPAFQATTVDGVGVAFAGGPVWASAWAPLPDDACATQPQVLAVAAHPHMDRVHRMADVAAYPSLIQLWSFGHLDNLQHSDGSGDVAVTTPPQFVMGVAHGRGAVWSLRWCPSGCFSPHNSRLGLLAAACSDGTVPVFAVPTHRPITQCEVYKAEASYELVPGTDEASQCTAVDWHCRAPHNVVAGGFASGLVALWDLNTRSSLLRRGRTISPFRVFDAHLSSITALSVSADGRLMTASLDRAVKVWPGCGGDSGAPPLGCLRKASATCAAQPQHWLNAIVAFDDVFSLQSTHVVGHSLRECYANSNVNFMVQDGTVWSVSFNDWLNAGACGSELGTVSVFFRQQLLVTEDSKKLKKLSFVGDILRCSMQALCQDDDRGNVELEELGEDYDDCISKVGLQLNFREDLQTEQKRPKPGSSTDAMDRFPVLSVNEVAWNRNARSFTWLAVGMQCGLVCAPRVRCVPHRELADFYDTI